jgi:uncharacterized membrane protein
VWLAHHGVFPRLRFVDARMIRINPVLLMTAAFLPFPTRLMAEAIDTARASWTCSTRSAATA